MARHRSPLRDEAFEIYKSKSGNIKPSEIADMLEVTPEKISSWKSADEWDRKLGFKRNKKGGQKGNANAVGNKGGGAPSGNINGFKHGAYISEDRFTSKEFIAKYLPKATGKIIDDIVHSGLSSLDMLWSSIMMKYAAIIRSQKIMHVKNHKDITKELKKEVFGKNSSQEYEIQFAWDKQERFLKAQAISMRELTNMIKSYEELLHKDWDLATEEQKARIEVLKSKIINSEDSKEDKIDSYFKLLEQSMKE